MTIDDKDLPDWHPLKKKRKGEKPTKHRFVNSLAYYSDCSWVAIQEENRRAFTAGSQHWRSTGHEIQMKSTEEVTILRRRTM